MRRFAAVLVVALASVACGLRNPGAPTADATPAPTSVSPVKARAAVMLAISPNPVVSTDSDDPAYPRQASWQVVLRETGGVGATVNFVNATLRDAATGVLADPHGVLSLSSADVLTAVGSNRLPAGGSIAVPQSVTYLLASGDLAPGRLAVTVQLTDDNGNVVGSSVNVLVE